MDTNSSVSVGQHAIPPGRFWAKFVQETGQWLSLAAHGLDVAMVFRALCDVPGIRRSLEYSASAPLSDCHLDRLSVLALIHDAGKANLGFQFKIRSPDSPQAGHIRELAPIFDPYLYDEDLHMSFLESLPPELSEWFLSEEDAISYLMATFSHHGRPLVFRGESHGLFRMAKEWWRPQGAWDPMKAVAELSALARLAFPDAFLPGGEPLPSAPEFHHRYAGLLMLADWLGSHPTWFPVENVPVNERLERNRSVIPRVLEAIGLDIATIRAQIEDRSHHFEDLFGLSPRPLQAMVDALDPLDPATQLIIAESETGSGKTEAALHWYFKLLAAGTIDSLFFALPTRVAARGIYDRVQSVIKRWFPDPSRRPVTVLAVPGYAQVDGIPAGRILPDEKAGNLWQDDPDLQRRERHWAAEHPKRFLAAPIAVGTIDQALLSTVQTAHAHLRSICLDRSLIVVDEVHASDFYMTRLLKALLRHHLSVGGRAMLLSATLGARSRHEYLSLARPNITMPPLAEAEAAAYPAVTLADGTLHATAHTTDAGKTVRFTLKPYAFKPEEAIPSVLDALRSNARVIVIMNTVDRANAFLRALEAHPGIAKSWLFKCNRTIAPHHGRFAPQDRTVLDVAVGRRLGPGTEPGPVVIVGTQTLEQSLDIDADLLITDLAPADVLLQRVGRLHRHRRNRPKGYETAQSIVLVPPDSFEAGLDERGNVLGTYRRVGYGSVYEDLRTLELTVRTLAARAEVRIPEDNRALVEAVTHPDCLQSLEGEKWRLHGESIDGGALAKAVAARGVTADFSAYFGECEFNEMGGKVAVRLGTDSLRLKVDRPFVGPFGVEVREVVIPGHLAPKDPGEAVRVEGTTEEVVLLLCGDRRYRYGRYGLEALT